MVFGAPTATTTAIIMQLFTRTLPVCPWLFGTSVVPGRAASSILQKRKVSKLLNAVLDVMYQIQLVMFMMSSVVTLRITPIHI